MDESVNGPAFARRYKYCNITDLVADHLSYHVLTQTHNTKPFFQVFVGRLESIAEDVRELFGRAIDVDELLQRVPELSKYLAKDVAAGRYQGHIADAKLLTNASLLRKDTLDLVRAYYQQDFACYGRCDTRNT